MAVIARLAVLAVTCLPMAVTDECEDATSLLQVQHGIDVAKDVWERSYKDLAKEAWERGYKDLAAVAKDAWTWGDKDVSKHRPAEAETWATDDLDVELSSQRQSLKALTMAAKEAVLAEKGLTLETIGDRLSTQLESLTLDATLDANIVREEHKLKKTRGKKKKGTKKGRQQQAQPDFGDTTAEGFAADIIPSTAHFNIFCDQNCKREAYYSGDRTGWLTNQALPSYFDTEMKNAWSQFMKDLRDKSGEEQKLTTIQASYDEQLGHKEDAEKNHYKAQGQGFLTSWLSSGFDPYVLRSAMQNWRQGIQVRWRNQKEENLVSQANKQEEDIIKYAAQIDAKQHRAADKARKEYWKQLTERSELERADTARRVEAAAAVDKKDQERREAEEKAAEEKRKELEKAHQEKMNKEAAEQKELTNKEQEEEQRLATLTETNAKKSADEQEELRKNNPWEQGHDIDNKTWIHHGPKVEEVTAEETKRKEKEKDAMMEQRYGPGWKVKMGKKLGSFLQEII